MNERIDVQEVKRCADLLALASGETQLKRVASTEGGEWHGPCPFCGGRDRLVVQPYHIPHPIWMCRRCSAGKFQDAIEFARRLWPGLKFAELCERLVGGKLPTTPLASRPGPAPLPAAAPPESAWQRSVETVLAECQATLWDPKYHKVLDYLRSRGLREETIRHFGLGYCATGKAEAYGREIAGIWVPRGIVIPGRAKGAVWYLKIRLMPGVPCRCQHCKRFMPDPGACPHCGQITKYAGVRGNRPAAIFNADELAALDIALFVEGEIDCMLAWQEIGDLLPVATLGASTNRPDLATWGRYFYGKRAVLLDYDNDDAGAKGAAALSELVARPVLAPLPSGGWKDLNEFFLAGGDLRGWITTYLTKYDPLPAGHPLPMVETAIALGGVPTEFPAQ